MADQLKVGEVTTASGKKHPYGWSYVSTYT